MLSPHDNVMGVELLPISDWASTAPRGAFDRLAREGGPPLARREVIAATRAAVKFGSAVSAAVATVRRFGFGLELGLEVGLSLLMRSNGWLGGPTFMAEKGNLGSP